MSQWKFEIEIWFENDDEITKFSTGVADMVRNKLAENRKYSLAGYRIDKKE